MTRITYNMLASPSDFALKRSMAINDTILYFTYHPFLYLQVSLVKSRTILNGLLAEMWTPEHDAQITDFVTDISEQLLLLFIDEQNGLSICNHLPSHPVEEIAYFAREEYAEVTHTNFSMVVQFGTVQGSYVDTLLRSMHNLYAPTVFENSSWPSSILPYRACKLCSMYMCWLSCVCVCVCVYE